MAIKVTISKSEPKTKPYPKYMISQQQEEYIIILATGETPHYIKGMCVESSLEGNVGKIIEWDKEKFKDFDRSLIKTDKPKTKTSYPKLIKYGRDIVELHRKPENPYQCIAIHRTGTYAGQISMNFYMAVPYEDFEGEITLTNE